MGLSGCGARWCREGEEKGGLVEEVDAGEGLSGDWWGSGLFVFGIVGHGSSYVVCVEIVCSVEVIITTPMQG